MSAFRVALIDDDQIFRLVFGKMLSTYERSQIEYVSYPDALQALDYFHEHRNDDASLPQMLFVDINMPFMTGWELLETMSSEEIDFVHRIPVFILSSSTSATDFMQADNYGFLDGYLTKPLWKQDLFAKLDACIE